MSTNWPGALDTFATDFDNLTTVAAAESNNQNAAILALEKNGYPVVNVKTFQSSGAVGNGVANDAPAIQGAINAVQSAGGGVVLLPQGTYKTNSTLQVTANVRMLIAGWGATLQPAASTDGLMVNQANGATALGCEVNGLTIDGQSGASTVGVRKRDTDRCALRNVRIVNCTTGLQQEAFASGRWAEENSLTDVFIFNCTTGINCANVSGTGSLGETHWTNVGISQCATGIALNNGITFYRSRLFGVTIWLPTNGVGLKLDCNVQDSVFVIDMENLLGTATGLTGVNVTTNAVNIPTLDCHLGFTGTFATPVSDSTGKGFTWRDGQHVYTTAAGNGIPGIGAIYGDTVDRVRVGTQFAGGGGLQFGAGSGVDTNLYRAGAALLATDSALRAGGHVLSTGTAPTAAAGANAGTGPPAPVVAANSTDVKGSLTFGTGTTPAAGAMAVVTFNAAFGAAPVVLLTWQNAAGAGLGQVYATSVGTGGFTIDCTTAPAASQANTTYSVAWHVLGAS